MLNDDRTIWTPSHFIGGHLALDLSNTVFDRCVPAADNELLKNGRDVAGWLQAAGLADDTQAESFAEMADGAVVANVRQVREATFSIIDAIADGRCPPADSLRVLLSCAANRLSANSFELDGVRPGVTLVRWGDPDSVVAFLAMLSIEAYFTLPRDRFGSCPRCGWVFLDVSRGGRRRWCSMQTCGNREKAARHRSPGQSKR